MSRLAGIKIQCGEGQLGDERTHILLVAMLRSYLAELKTVMTLRSGGEGKRLEKKENMVERQRREKESSHWVHLRNSSENLLSI